MDLKMVKTTRSKKGLLDSKEDHSKMKSGLLKNLSKKILYKRQLFANRKYKKPSHKGN